MSLSIKWLLVVLLDVFLLLFSLFNLSKGIMVLIILLWFNGILFCLDDLYKRGAFFAFLLSFFIILIGRESLEVFGLHEIEFVFSEEINNHAHKSLLISLMSLYLGFFIASKIAEKPCRQKINYNSNRYVAIRSVSSLLFLVTFSFNLLTLFDIILSVLKNGYFAFYSTHTSNVPYVIKKIGDMCLICFWIYLATMPKKKDVIKMSSLYFIYLLLTLGTGKRFPFVAGILTLFVYSVARNKVNSGGTIWIKNKTMLIVLFLIPLMIFGLYAIGQVRANSLIWSFGFDKVILNFLYSQGVSVNVIKRAILYQDMMPQGKLYLFGTTFETIINNVIFRVLIGPTQLTGNTIAHAVDGYSFQHALSYTAMGSYYLAGHGLGSCYIAEAFHDYGYLGVVVVNVVYGFMFCKVFDLGKHGVLGTTVKLCMLYSILLAPRGSADGFITDIIDLTTWGTIVVVLIFANILRGRTFRSDCANESTNISGIV